MENSYIFGKNPVFRPLCPDILVTTPGILEHHFCSLSRLSHLRYIVLDEADRLLSPSQESWRRSLVASFPQLQGLSSTPSILSSTHPMAPIKLFLSSATLYNDDFMGRELSVGRVVNVQPKGSVKSSGKIDRIRDASDDKITSKKDLMPISLPTIPISLFHHTVFVENPMAKALVCSCILGIIPMDALPSKLKDIISSHSSSSSSSGNVSALVKFQGPFMVFVNTLEAADRLSLFLNALSAIFQRKYKKKHSSVQNSIYNMSRASGEALSSLLSSLSKQYTNPIPAYPFSGNIPPILITTDAACRGLDTYVYTSLSFDAPQSVTQYIHRGGRAARAGKDGLACVLCEGDRKSTESLRVRQFVDQVTKQQERTRVLEIMPDGVTINEHMKKHKKGKHSSKSKLKLDDQTKGMGIPPRLQKISHAKTDVEEDLFDGIDFLDDILDVVEKCLENKHIWKKDGRLKGKILKQHVFV
ncbi:hypothetical protein ADUPG1_006685 [Aduncisulcus paluster]|uniref:ATP-dependent RNA helicase n=1 Tax=Aduncisulcus paluster TaxID=2918883 RepID=A0ABQ5KKU0_9EUKA|nr:hypothetical protein ADUPG1_006685 [Aduncisulcus paluster]